MAVIPHTPQEDEAFDELAERIADLLAPRLAETLDDRPLKTIPEVAEHLRVSATKTYGLVRDGLLSTVRIGDQQRVEPGELDRYIAACRGGVDADEDGGR